MQKTGFNFLIIGAGRGGTSLIAAMLDSHSSLEVGLELFSVNYLMGKEIKQSDHDLIEKRVTAFLAACNKEAKKYSKKLWGNKITTEQLHGLEDHNSANPGSPIEVFDYFFNERLKDVKVIFILRDGRTCINSKVSRTGQSFSTAGERWKYSVMLYRFLKERHSNNICIKFEELLAEPEKTLNAVCKFLKVPYEDSMQQGTSNPKMRPEYRQKTIDTSKTAATELPDDTLKNISHDLIYCGYL
jgi:hypothetical protein